MDGMPIVLSDTIDGETLEPEDFKVITSAGIERVHPPASPSGSF